MSQKHAKSPCCRGKIYHFGQRRRQCFVCKKTWRIRQKKKGRKLKRISRELVKRYLSNGSFNLEEHAHRLGLSLAALHYRIRKSRDIFLEKEHWLSIPVNQSFIIIVDALILQIQKRFFTAYFILLRSIKDDKAIILEPSIFSRYENKADWQHVLNRIPEKSRRRILALVGDGEPCFATITRQHGWLLQRCHFHLLAELYRFASFKRKSRNRKLAEKINKLVRSIISTTNIKELKRSLRKVNSLIQNPDVPERIKARFLKGFCRNFQFYRTYLNYPNLNLPITTNSCETLCRITRNFLNKIHGLNTAQSLTKWIKALMLFRKKIYCKRTNFQPR
jgi:DNA-binding Lrp family transcriptional regulator